MPDGSPHTPTGWWRPAGRGGRLALLAATLWPVIYFGLFMVFFFSMAMGMKTVPQGAPHGPPPMFMVMFAGHCLTMLILFGLLGFYIVSVIRNPRLDSTMRIIWVLVMFFGSAAAMLVYWFLYVWRDPPPESP